MSEYGYIPESYNYATKIISPDELQQKGQIGINGNHLTNNVNAMVSYIDLNLGGNSLNGIHVTENNNVLGNKYFLKTFLKCKDIETKKSVGRMLYINNVPTGKFKLLGGGKTSFRGLLPGIVSNIENLNPFDAFQELMGSSTPDCVKIKLEEIGDDGKPIKSKPQYITLRDLEDMLDMDEHITQDNKPQYNRECISNWDKGKKECNVDYQGFGNRLYNNKLINQNNEAIKTTAQSKSMYYLYYTCVSILLGYIIYRLTYVRRY